MAKRHLACGHKHSLNEPCPVRREGPQAWLHTITDGPSADDPARVLAALSAVRDLRRWLADTEHELVQLARRRGLSWVQLGATWGLSRQGAHNRWARHVTPTTASRPVTALSAPQRPVPAAPVGRPSPPASGPPEPAQSRPRPSQRSRRRRR
jgi:hypothetical protein